MSNRDRRHRRPTTAATKRNGSEALARTLGMGIALAAILFLVPRSLRWPIAAVLVVIAVVIEIRTRRA